jgi:hypothetical protein
MPDANIKRSIENISKAGLDASLNALDPYRRAILMQFLRYGNKELFENIIPGAYKIDVAQALDRLFPEFVAREVGRLTGVNLSRNPLLVSPLEEAAQLGEPPLLTHLRSRMIKGVLVRERVKDFTESDEYKNAAKFAGVNAFRLGKLSAQRRKDLGLETPEQRRQREAQERNI